MPDPSSSATFTQAKQPGIRRFAAAALTLALAGVAIGIGSWARPLPSPYFVPLWVTQYRSRAIPDRSEADADRSGMREAGFFPRLANTDASQEANLLMREVDQLQRLHAHDSLVLYLSGFAQVRAGGDVEFIPADADPPGGREGLSLRDILQKVKAARPRAKLVVLDLAGAPPEPRVGILWTDPTAHITELVNEVDAEHKAAHPNAPPDWLVLCSASPGQTPYGNRILGRTVFGYYFENGLRGAAVPYNPSGRSGRRVTVRGLSSFLRARIDRWVRENEGRRQIPILLGDGPDFELVSAPGGDTPIPGAMLNEALLNGWSTLTQWQTDGSLSQGPRIFRRLQDGVRVAQAGRRFGGANDRGYLDLTVDLTRLGREMTAAKLAPKRPTQVVSVALARALGETEDPVAIAAVDALLASSHDATTLPTAGQEAAIAKAVAAFVKAVADKSPFAVESALLSRSRLAANRAADIRIFDRALTERKVPLAYIETYFLRRLADLSRRAPVEQWPADVARAGLDAVIVYEAAASHPDVFPWTKDVLQRANMARWGGEILLSFWGSVPPADVLARFHDATRLATAVNAFASAYVSGRRIADEALTGLVPEASVLQAFPDRMPLWKTRLKATGDLVHLLMSPGTPTDAPGLLDQADQLRRAAAAMSSLTTTLDQVTGASDVEWAVSATQTEAAPPDFVRTIEFLFALPRLSQDRRAALDQAGHNLAKRLAERTLAADRNDDLAKHVTATVPYGAEEGAADRRFTAAQVAIRAECHLAILRFAGMPAATLDPLDKLLETVKREGPDSPAWVGLSQGLGRAWSTGFDSMMLDAPTNRLDMLAILLPGFTPTRFDTLSNEPRIVARRAAWADFFGWSGVAHRQIARAGFDRDFLESVASAEMAVGNDAEVPPPLLVFDEPTPLVLTATRPTAEVRVTIRHPGPLGDTPITVRALPPGDTVRVTAEMTALSPDPAGGGMLGTLIVRAEVVNPVSPGLIPDGVVIEARAGERQAFVRVDIDGSRLVNPVEIVVDRVPVDPVGLGDDIRIRPGAGEPLFVFVRNRGTAKRELMVKASSPGVAATVEAKVAVGPGETRLVPFPAAAPTPAPMAGAPAAPASATFDLPGTLKLDAVDATDATITQSRTFRLSVSEPFEYVELSSAVYQPIAVPLTPENRMAVTLRALRDLGAIPSNATLVVDQAHIPGLRGIRAGQFAGRIPPDSSPLTLDASGLVLDPEAKRQGQVSVTVDGVTRAFRLNVDFVLFGAPISPAVDTTPNLELLRAPVATPGSAVAFKIGADRAPPGATLDARLVRHDPGREPTVEATRTLPAVRRRQATVASGPSGSLQLAATIQDWDVTWDVPQLLGRRTVIARLLAADKTVLATKEIGVILDSTPPTLPTFGGLPEQVKKGSLLSVTVTATDPESGIASVAFFVGKLGPDGKVPQGTATIPGVRSPTDPTQWTASVQLPRDKTGMVDVTSVAVNGAGLSSSSFASVEVVETLPEKPAAIGGQLTEGSIPQAGLEVTLYDATGKALFKATTDANGNYLFPNLKPGGYTLTAAKVATRRKASTTANAVAGVTTTANLSLYLQP